MLIACQHFVQLLLVGRALIVLYELCARIDQRLQLLAPFCVSRLLVELSCLDHLLVDVILGKRHFF
eukprot:COSAG06_NODE_1745_length_8496_cov_3.733595_2_plen_66_part_00